MVIDDYRKYIKFDQASNQFKLNEDIYFQIKNVYTEKSAQSGKNYFSGDKEFYHEFRITQAFEEV